MFHLTLPLGKVTVILFYNGFGFPIGRHECLYIGITVLPENIGELIQPAVNFLLRLLYPLCNSLALLAFENACDFGKLRSQLRQLSVLYLLDFGCTLSEPVQKLFHLFEYCHVDTGLRFRRQLRLTDQKLQNRLCFLYDGAE